MRSRRTFLFTSVAALGAAAAAAWRFWPEHGIVNPCRAALPPRLANHPIVHEAWDGIEPSRVWDCHAHLAGSGDSGSGIRLNPRMSSLLSPIEYAQQLFYLNAGCAHAAPGRIDESYVERMHNLLDGMRPGCKLLLLAFERHFDANGDVSWDDTSFYVPDAYAAAVARAHPEYFEWAASIHPYRRDCLEALANARRAGARAVKWLPAAMNIDPASKRCDPYYAALKDLGLPLITHAGMERALAVGDRQHLGNPLRLRRALEHGVCVVVAHCATLGQDRDIDRGPDGPLTDSFALFARLMDDHRHEGRLFGDLSAVTQWNRAGPALAHIVEREDWHPRLLNGSDYPLPGIMPLYSLEYLAELKLLDLRIAAPLGEIRAHNPLLFDFVLKRHLRSRGMRLSRQVFETRPFFAPQP